MSRGEKVDAINLRTKHIFTYIKHQRELEGNSYGGDTTTPGLETEMSPP